MGEISLFVEFVVLWFGKTFHVTYPTFFLLFSFLLLLIVLALGAALSFTGLFFHVIPESNVKWFYLGTLFVPFTPIIVAVIELLGYFSRERKKYKQLKNAIMDFENYKKESGSKTRRS